ncbi:hypothetical protein JRI60_27155 [Archangium violaceum]|uniref:hypothetical protein n=1 Tax=Archangium violaceum TaxID=83451 RepID=UPI00194EC8F6|nr:hypothetical protein [Archangium violaceum]QRN92891.1 hypothetical protein JRI60_27155 [Archangium violaceum]
MRQVLASRRGPSARGAASVEMALCMLVIIPVFLYSIFLDDLLRYSLDQQEAALSTVWDLTVQDYVKQGDPTTVQHHARLMYCDHESGRDRYDKRASGTDANGNAFNSYADCEGEDHHESLAAHQCWINPNAKQVTCTGPEKGAGSVNADTLFNDYHGQFTQGGLYRCSARLVVENYLLPKSFLPEFSDDHGKVNLTKDQWQGTSIHDNAKQGTGGKDGNAYFIKEQRLAIITDTWALTDPADLNPGQKRSGDMYARVANIYQNNANVGFTQMTASASSFFSSASGSLLNPGLVGSLSSPGNSNAETMNADDPRQPNISIHPTNGAPTQKIDQGKGGNQNYFNSEWRDWDQDRTQKTHQARGGYYMGCKNAEEC